MENPTYQIIHITPTFLNDDDKAQASKSISATLILNYLELEKLGLTS